MSALAAREIEGQVAGIPACRFCGVRLRHTFVDLGMSPSFFSFGTMTRILAAPGLTIFDVEQLATHGGSLRTYACLAPNLVHPVQPEVRALMALEERAGLAKLDGYQGFAERAKQAKFALVDFLMSPVRAGKSVARYGAPSKSATLLHYAGTGRDLNRVHSGSQPS
ncbi:MAG: hypothetical protein ACLPND_23935 [Candidatus Korobacteraceae bacterium]|jgi:hypothetical protein